MPQASAPAARTLPMPSAQFARLATICRAATAWPVAAMLPEPSTVPAPLGYAAATPATPPKSAPPALLAITGTPVPPAAVAVGMRETRPAPLRAPAPATLASRTQSARPAQPATTCPPPPPAPRAAAPQPARPASVAMPPDSAPARPGSPGPGATSVRQATTAPPALRAPCVSMAGPATTEWAGWAPARAPPPGSLGPRASAIPAHRASMALPALGSVLPPATRVSALRVPQGLAGAFVRPGG